VSATLRSSIQITGAAHLEAPDRDPVPRQAHSTFAPETATTFCHFAISTLTNLVNSSGVIGAAATPFSNRRCRRSGAASAFIIAACIFAT
jgi:hypothetical protein